MLFGARDCRAIGCCAPIILALGRANIAVLEVARTESDQKAYEGGSTRLGD